MAKTKEQNFVFIVIQFYKLIIFICATIQQLETFNHIIWDRKKFIVKIQISHIFH
jgi:hypothetical protein